MSSHRRPWYPWYPKDFIADEKVQSLSDDAELLYRRMLDILWQANDLQMLCNCTKLANALCRNWSAERFQSAWEEIQTPGFELLKTSECGNFVYSKRLKEEADKITKISKTRANAAKAKHMQSKCKTSAKHLSCHTDTHTHTDTDINKKKKIVKRKNASQIPHEFKLTDIMRQYAIEKGISKFHIDSLFEHFTNYHTAKGSTFKDWQAAWRTWVINDTKFNRGGSATDLTEAQKKEREEICKRLGVK